MEKIFNLVHPKLDQNVFCENPDPFRFSWLSRFFCPTNPPESVSEIPKNPLPNPALPEPVSESDYEKFISEKVTYR